jgi:hypothetical protein
MIDITYRVIDDRPIEWSKTPSWQLPWSPFTAPWSKTRDLLDKELNHMNARKVELALGLRAGDLNRDGSISARARLTDPGVILSFETSKHGVLTYPCRTYTGRPESMAWQENVRAIALGLEALRKVERYGIAARGQQYAGWRALGAGIPLEGSMTEAEAWRVLREAVRHPDSTVRSKDVEWLFRIASLEHHPDVGGDSDHFARLVTARAILVGAS